MIARYRDGTLASRRGSERSARTLDALGTRGRRTARRLGPDGRARGDLEGRPPAQPHVEETQAVGAREGRGAQRGELDAGALRPRRRPALRRGRVSRVPAGDRAAHPRGAWPAGRPRRWETRRAADGRGGRRASSLPRRSSRGSTRRQPPRDRHARAPRRVRRARRSAPRPRARRPASTASSRSASAIELVPRARSTSPSAHDGRLRVARDPSAPGRRRRGGARRRARALLEHPQRRGRRRDRPRLLPRLRAARRAAERSSRPQLALAAELRQAGRRPHARGRRRHARRASRGSTAPSSCTASRRRPAARSRSSAATTSRSPATSPTRRRRSCGSPPSRCPPTASSPRPTAPTSRRSRVRGRPNEPANVVHTVAALADARGDRRGRARRADRRRTPRAPSGCRERDRVTAKRSSASTSSSTRTSSASSAGSPSSTPTTSCSRSVPGLGVLTRYLADRVSHVHAVEIDRSLEPQLAERSPGTNVDVVLRRRARARPRPRSSRRRASSSRTFPTTSRRRSSSRASTGCRASSAGA